MGGLIMKKLPSFNIALNNYEYLNFGGITMFQKNGDEYNFILTNWTPAVFEFLMKQHRSFNMGIKITYYLEQEGKSEREMNVVEHGRYDISTSLSLSTKGEAAWLKVNIKRVD